MREYSIISCVEDNERFIWETTVQLHNARKYNLSDKFRILVFLPAYNLSRGLSPKWKELANIFKETKFFFFVDKTASVTDLAVEYQYIPIHRLCSLEQHFKDFPELEKQAILYIDSDVIFTSTPKFLDYLEDDVNYLSDTHTYLNHEYLASKEKDIVKGKEEEYKKANVIAKAASFAKLTEEDLKQNNNNTGGAHYLFKNITSKFFSSCIETCLLVRMYFQVVNQQFFPGDLPLERENNGIQSWCADMWSIQWNLWRFKLPSETPSWMDFTWATEETSKLDKRFWMHNAGVTADSKIRIVDNLKSKKDEEGKLIIIDAPAFYKESYKNRSVFDDIENLQKILDHPESIKYCTSVYVQEIIDTYNSLIKK